MTRVISVNSIVVASSDQVSCDLAGEAAILRFNSGVYYGLDAVGAYIWNLIQQPITVSALRDAVLEAYDVEPTRCERDLLALLRKLADEGLIEVRSAKA